MRSIKFFCITLLLLVFGGIFAGSAFAAGGSKICDNDPWSSGCSATQYGTWRLISVGYSGDSRVQFTSDQTSGSKYLYGLSSGLTSSISLNYWAYLNSSYATCNYAEYDTVSGYLTTIDQNLAAPGWNYLGSDRDYGAVPLSVHASIANGDLTADAVQISW